MEVQCFHAPYTCSSSRPNKKYWCEHCLSATSNTNCLHYPYDCISSRPDKQHWCSFCMLSHKPNILPRNGTYASHIQSQLPVTYPPIYAQPVLPPALPPFALHSQILLPPPGQIPVTWPSRQTNVVCRPCPPLAGQKSHDRI